MCHAVSWGEAHTLPVGVGLHIWECMASSVHNNAVGGPKIARKPHNCARSIAALSQFMAQQLPVSEGSSEWDLNDMGDLILTKKLHSR